MKSEQPKALAAIRLYHGYSVQDIADYLHVNVGYVNSFELKESHIHLDDLTKLAKLYDIDVNSLVYLIEDIQNPTKISKKFKKSSIKILLGLLRLFTKKQ